MESHNQRGVSGELIHAPRTAKPRLSDNEKGGR